MDLISTRKHWIVLVRMPAIALLVLAMLLSAFHTEPKLVVHALHVTTTSPLASPLRLAFQFAPVIAFLSLGAAALVELLAVVAWLFETISVDGRSVNWTVWPSRSESLAIASIADVRWTKNTLFAFVFGYGTLVLDGGRHEETITCVPHVAELAAAIRRVGR